MVDFSSDNYGFSKLAGLDTCHKLKHMDWVGGVLYLGKSKIDATSVTSVDEGPVIVMCVMWFTTHKQSLEYGVQLDILCRNSWKKVRIVFE
jgi:hypothetical protein